MKSSPMMTRKSAWNNATDTLMLTAVASPLASALPASAPAPLQTIWWAIGDAPGVLTSSNAYEAQALIYTLAGLANSAAEGVPALLIDNGALDIDDSHSDQKWRSHLNASGLAKFSSLHDPSLCTLVAEYSRSGAFNGATLYSSDSFSVYVAMTLAGLTRALPVSPTLRSQYSCLAAFP